MRKNLVMFVVLCFVMLSLQATGAMAGEYYSIGINPVQPDRTLQPGECMGKWNFPVPGQMGTKTGFRGDKSLPPLTPLIFNEELNGKVIPDRSELVIYMCGNGFRLGIPLDTIKAVSVECFKKPTPAVERIAVEHPRFIISGAYVPPPVPVQTVVVKHHKVWPWVVLGVIVLGLAAASGGGGHNSTSVRPGPTIP